MCSSVFPGKYLIWIVDVFVTLFGPVRPWQLHKHTAV